MGIMATLLTKINRVNKKQKLNYYYLFFNSKEPNGEVRRVVIKRDPYGIYDSKVRGLFGENEFTSLESLEMYFPGILNAEVLEQKEWHYGRPAFVIDYTASNFYKRKDLYMKLFEYRQLKSTAKYSNCTEYLTIADAYMEFCKANKINIKNQIDFLKELRYCNQYDLNALKSGLYILKNNIRATKVRYCYCGRRCWDVLGFKSEILNGVRSVRQLKDEVGKSYCNYVFLTEKKFDDKYKDVEAKKLIKILKKLPKDAEIKVDGDGLFAVTGANYENDSIFLRLKLISW